MYSVFANIYFSVNLYVCILYTYCRHIHVCINVYMISFNMYIMAVVCLDGFLRAETLITDSSCSDYG